MDPLAARALADAIDAVLPQTQCGRCGEPGCRPYADAVAAGEAINRCPPGGERLITTLAAMTGRTDIPLDPALGGVGVLQRAVIDEDLCIGCTLCIQACPVDAIIGGPKHMHAVIAAACTGCALCVAPCPVDCIAMIPAGRAWSASDAADARERYTAREARARTGTSSGDARGHARPVQDHAAAPVLSREQRQAAAAAALVRARARRHVRA